MVSYGNDRVLLIVGILLVIAIIGWIAASIIIPDKEAESVKKGNKYSSTGKALGESNYCKNHNQGYDGCQKICFRSGSPSCGKPSQSG